MTIPFKAVGDTVNIAVNASSQVLLLTPGSDNVIVTNIGTQIVFIQFGNSTTTVTVDNGYPLLANSTQSFSKNGVTSNKLDTHCAVIAAGTGSRVYVSTGEGK